MTPARAAILAMALAWAIPAHAAGTAARNAPMVLQDVVVPDLPIPPMPPAEPPDDSAAPVPLGDSPGIATPAVSSNAPSVQPNLFTQKSYDGGNGYLNGSGVQGEQNRRETPPAGLQLNVPLQ